MPLPCLFLVGTFTTDWGLVQKPLVGAACSQCLHWLHQARLWFLEAVNPSWSWPFSGQTHTRGRAQSDFCRIWSLSPDDPSKAAVMIWNDPKWRPCLPRKSKIFSSSFSPMPASAAAQASLLCVCCLPRALTEAHTAPLGLPGSDIHFCHLPGTSAPTSDEIFARHNAELKGALSLVLPVALTSFWFVILVSVWSFSVL